MIDTLIACDNEDETLGAFFQECASDAKSACDAIPFPVTELFSNNLNDVSINLKISIINKQNFLFAAYSHGADNCLVTGAIDPYISTELNHTIFTNAFVYTFACSCGKLLGKSLIDNGAKLFWGYDRTVYVILSHQQIFTECANEGLKIISAGKSISSAVNAVEKKYNEHIDSNYQLDMFVATTLMDNRDALVIMGGKDVDFDNLRLYD